MQAWTTKIQRTQVIVDADDGGGFRWLLMGVRGGEIAHMGEKRGVFFKVII